MTIHKEGHRIIAINTAFWVILTAVMWLFCHSVTANIIVSAVAAFFICFTIYFFRLPNLVPTIDPEAVISPADGKVVNIKETTLDEFIGGPCLQISIFLAIYDVHANFFPVGGKVLLSRYYPGKYLLAFHPKASEKNERTSIGMETDSGKKILFRQIAGYVARRIVCYAKEGESYSQSTQCGYIKFGSRMDLFLPLDAEILVKKGDRVKASISKLAILK